jgi:hypothetical protein
VPIDRAWTTPAMLSTVSANAPRAAARISMEPPSAWIRPSCSSRFFASVRVGLEEEQAVALDVDRDRVRRDHADAAAVGDDVAGVADARPGQDDGAARRRDRAFVAHFAALRRAPGIDRGEAVAAGEEVAVGERQGRRDEPADIDPGVRAEHDAVRVDEENLPVADISPEDVRRVVAGDAVERDRARSRAG